MPRSLRWTEEQPAAQRSQQGRFFSFQISILIFFWLGMLQEWRMDMKGPGNKWD